MSDIVIKSELDILGGITPVLYGTNPFHRLLTDENIGENGENLTIVVLSCERPDATIKMMNSIKEYIPNFKGKYLIADNGSSEETIKKLKNEFSKMPYECNIIEFGENLGVAKGRNRAVEHVDTEWFMSLDNDILFSCNILPEIQATISQFGCNFVNLPLLNDTGNQLFAAGGNIFIEQIGDEIHIGHGSIFAPCKCETNQRIPRVLSTFIFGGASVLRKSTFEECGKFDEGMFVGFEDNDFSITVFKKGYKVGTIGILGLIHDHKKPENQNDLEYEKQRFSNVRLLKSARYFEKKHNLKIWNEVTESWLKEKEKELGITSGEVEQEERMIKKKLTVVALRRTKKLEEQIQKLNNEIQDICEIKMLYFDDIDENAINLIYGMQNVNKVYIIDKDILNRLNKKELDNYIEKYNLNKQNFLDKYVNKLDIFTKANKAETFFGKEIQNIKDNQEIRKLIEN